jgi:23S rRNA (guanosine2251-2'-O)-methyltransferase
MRPGKPRSDRPDGDRKKPDGPRGPRGDARGDAPRGPRGDGPRGPRGDAPRGPFATSERHDAPRPAPRPPAVRPDLPPVRGDRLEGRNVVLEALVRKRRAVRTIWLDIGAKSDDKVSEILALGGNRIQRVERHILDRMSLTGVHNGVIAEADDLPEPSIRELLAIPEPFLVLIDEIQYEHNLGAVLRSSLGAGVDGVIIPTHRGKGLTPVVQRVSMGGAEAVPVVRAGISSALADIRRAGVRVVGADMDGVPPWDIDLTGPVAFVLGGEDKGLTDPVRKRCDVIAGIPLAGGLQSLNVSVTAGVLLFERVRQMAKKARGEEE